jgi:hypothetical protein
MSKNEQIRNLLRSIVQAKAPGAKVYTENQNGATKATWPGYMRLSPDLVHGYVIEWEGGSQPEAKTPKTAEQIWIFSFLGFYEKKDSSSVNTFTDSVEKIIFECKPEGQKPLPEGGQVKFGSFNWKFETGEPGELLQIWSGKLQVKFREGC